MKLSGNVHLIRLASMMATIVMLSTLRQSGLKTTSITNLIAIRQAKREFIGLLNGKV